MEANSGVAVPEKQMKNRKRKPKSIFWLNLFNYTAEFTDKTSLHGVKYLGERERSIYEKIWWLIIFAVSIFMCTSLILNTYQKWVRTPVMISSDADPLLIWQIPFPAITICPTNKIKQTVFNYTNYYQKLMQQNFSGTEMKKFLDLGVICSMFKAPNVTTIEEDVVHLYHEVAPNLDDVLLYCEFQTDFDCSDMFSTILTEEGICFTTNMLNWNEIYTNEAYRIKNHLNFTSSTNWSLDYGYEADDIEWSYPARTMLAEANSGVTVMLKSNEEDFDYVCSGPLQGYNLMLHHPGEIPKVKSRYLHIAPSTDTFARIKPFVMDTSTLLGSYRPERRNCYFEHERKLKFYNKYSYDNCRNECLSNFTLSFCGCVPFYVPHTKNTSMCGAGKMECVTEAKRTYLKIQIKKDTMPLNESDSFAYCGCLPSCTTMEFHAEISQDEFNWRSVLKAFNGDMNETSGITLTRIQLFYDETEFRKYTRQELYYDLTGLMANCGGLLGLFFGFSFLSLVEVIYFLTWRLFSNLKRYGKKYWSGSPEVLDNLER